MTVSTTDAHPDPGASSLALSARVEFQVDPSA